MQSFYPLKLSIHFNGELVFVNVFVEIKQDRILPGTRWQVEK